jgi:hypothetical protein
MQVDSALWAIAMLGVIARPWNSPEFVWAMAGAAMPVPFGWLSWVSRQRESGGDAPNTDSIRRSNLGNDLDAA